MAGDAPADDLSVLLEDERIALREGRLDALPDLAARKERLVALLSADPPAPALARRLSLALDRNRDLIAAAADGLGRARDRIADIRAGEERLGTYGADGRKAAITRPRRSFETKA